MKRHYNNKVKHDEQGRIIGCGYCANEKNCEVIKNARSAGYPKNFARDADCPHYVHHEDIPAEDSKRPRIMIVESEHDSFASRVATLLGKADHVIETVKQDQADMYTNIFVPTDKSISIIDEHWPVKVKPTGTNKIPKKKKRK